MAIGGLDVGTSGCKFVVFHKNGEILCQGKRKYQEYGTDGIREIHPPEVWSAVIEVLKECVDKCPELIEGIAVTALGESFVALDECDTPLNTSMVTGDKRGICEVRELTAYYRKEKLMELTGVSPSEMYALPKMIWTKRNTDIFGRTRYLFMYEDFIGYMLTGKREISYSSASRSMAFDIRKKEWCTGLLDWAGISGHMMSKPVPSGKVIGTIKKEICALTGLSEQVALVSGGHDQMCAALGNGVISAGVCGDGMGTCEVMTALLKEIPARKEMADHELACVPYIRDGIYLTYLVLTNCGILMNWYLDTFLNEQYVSEEIRKKNRFEMLDADTLDQPTGLLVIPNFGSAGNPHVDYEAKGTIWGLTIHTKPWEIFRAFKEGMAYHMKLCLESLKILGAYPETVRISGGGANSDVTMQIRADVFGLPVCRMENPEAGAAGCMILTGMALGYYRDENEAVEKTIKVRKIFYPDMDKHRQYTVLYRKYRKLYQSLYEMH